MKSIKKLFFLFLPLLIGCLIAVYFIVTKKSDVRPKNQPYVITNQDKLNSSKINYDSLFFNIILDTNSKTRKLIDSLTSKSAPLNKKTIKKNELKRPK